MQLESSGGNQPRLLREVAYERLKNAIKSGDFKPSDPLSETHLSDALGISRTPVREALQKLAQEGMVQVLPNRAVVVAQPSFQDVLNILHVRLLLEPELVRLVTETISDEGLATLSDLVAKMKEAAERGDRTGWSKFDSAFHETIARACPNKLLAEIAMQMRNRMHFTATDSQTSKGRLVACTEEHLHVIEALSKRDAAGASEAMRSHLQEVRTSFFKRLGYA